ncbi:MAG: WD40 repeat domain-containing protein [Planctomycetaceae bacterium]|nr:WD40 repeat domain-containing protein [Planctomycetaceae bacterium]
MRLPAFVLLALLAPGAVGADSGWRQKVVDLTRLEVLSTVDKKYTHCISPSGTAFAVFDANVVRLVDPRDGHELQALAGHGGMIHDAGWSRDGRLIATSGYDETIRVWETATGKQVLNVKPLASFACSVAFSPDGRWLAAGGSDDGQLKIIDVSTGRVAREIKTADTALYAVEFTPDGSHLIVNHTVMNRGDTSLRIYKLSDWTEVKSSIKGPATSFALSRDGRLFAYATPGGTIVLLETGGWTELRSIDAHPFGASSLAFHPRGRHLASSGRDGAVRLWDTQHGRLVNTLAIKGEVDSRLAFGSDEDSLVVATADATVKLFGRREVPNAISPRPAAPAPK